MASHTDPPAAEGGENVRPRGMDTLTFRKDHSLHPVTDLSAAKEKLINVVDNQPGQARILTNVRKPLEST